VSSIIVDKLDRLKNPKNIDKNATIKLMKYFNYTNFWTKEHRRSLFVGLFILAVAIIFQFYSSAYVNKISSNSVADFLLNLLPVVNLNWIIIEGAFLAILFTVILILAKPQYLLFTIKAVGIFIATRAVFIAATHIGIYPGQINPDTTGVFDNLYTGLGLQAGFFFSGHTGLPLLMSVIFWDEKVWRYVYMIMGLVFGVTVLFAHVHYTIDVLAAPYMTYGIFKMTQYFFPDDYLLVEPKTRI
jgi:hypothetical protein